MGMPDPKDGWVTEMVQQQVEQRQIRVPGIQAIVEKQETPQMKLLLGIIELFGPGTALTLMALGGLVVARKFYLKWFGEKDK